ncbi:MAG: VWA domain-containing protein [Chlamydiae bacterium]|nr:VWA domain-containing protein [Chlamydiota bacterium]
MSENGCLSESQVKEGISAVLDSALKVASAVKGTQIGIAIIGFNSQSRVICEPREINSTSVSEIKSKLQSYKSEGQTKIISGFDHATKTLESMARQNRKAVQVLVLLTDGEEGNVSKSDVASIHTRLAAIKAKLFAIGIGVNHKKETLRLIAPTGGKFTGTYIDTTVEGQSIVKAISTVYQQAIASFSQLVLVSSQLAAGTWSVDGKLSTRAGEESKCELGVLSEGKESVKQITIHPEKLAERLDLAELSFQLSFTDPTGRKGSLSLPWNPDFIIDPKIIADTSSVGK